jgi:hypothetical protein
MKIIARTSVFQSNRLSSGCFVALPLRETTFVVVVVVVDDRSSSFQTNAPIECALSPDEETMSIMAVGVTWPLGYVVRYPRANTRGDACPPLAKATLPPQNAIAFAQTATIDDAHIVVVRGSNATRWGVCVGNWIDFVRFFTRGFD